MKQYDIYGIGAALVDTEITTDDNFLAAAGIEKGVMTLVDNDRQQDITQKLSSFPAHISQASGGSACNTVVAASYFGSQCYFSGRVASDELGEFFINDLKQADVGFKDDQLPTGTTGKCLVMVTPDAERTMNTFLGANDEFASSDLNFDAIAQSRYLYIEGYLVTSDNRKKVAIDAKKHAESHGALTSISLSDPAMVQFFGDTMKEIIGTGVDLLFCNEDEALSFTGTDSLEAAIEAMKTYSKQFAITRGAKGSTVFDGTQLIHCEGTAVKAIDTNGAGDMFAGAFLHALCSGFDFKAAGKFANKAASQVVVQYGPRLPKAAHAPLLAALN